MTSTELRKVLVIGGTGAQGLSVVHSSSIPHLSCSLKLTIYNSSFAEWPLFRERTHP